MSRHDLAIRGERIITPGGEVAGCVVVDDGRITAVLGQDESVDAARIVDVPTGLVMMPGLVDTHVHVNEPGRTEWEGFASASRAAGAGGITTLIDMPLNSIPATVDVAALEIKRQAADGKCAIDVGFWGGAVPGNQAHLAALHEAGVFGFKCFLLPSGVAEFPELNAAELERYLGELSRLDAMMIVHAEDPDVIAHAPRPSGTDYAGFLASRPRAAESTAVQTVIEAARRTGARVHIVHLSDADALPAIAAAKADGVRLSVETCPHYLVFESGSIPAGATQFKCCPPIREAENRERLWQALGAGLIDFVVSDHSPCLPSLKLLDSGDFGAAWGGIASVQLSLPAVWTEAQARGFAVTDVVRWMSARPAEFAGLSGKGAISPGRDADFALFDPDADFIVDARTLRHRNPVTPYDGRNLRGVVRETWLRGQPISFDQPAGRLLSRHHDREAPQGHEPGAAR
jgi:allantoinase